MADKKKLVSEITSMDVDFAQWYTDIVKKAEMIDYSSVKGCVIMRPYAQAIWENIQKTLDGMFKETGHELSLIHIEMCIRDRCSIACRPIVSRKSPQRCLKNMRMRFLKKRKIVCTRKKQLWSR